MIKQNIKKILHYFGYEIHRIKSYSPKKVQALIAEPPPVNPVWPLPRRSGGPSDEEIREEFAKYDLWHYAYKFDKGLSFDLMLKHIRVSEWFEIPIRTTDMPRDYLDHRRASWLIKV